MVDELVVAAPKDPVHQSAAGQQVVEFLGAVLPAFGRSPHLDDPDQHEQVEAGDQVEEHRRDDGADDPAGGLEAVPEPRGGRSGHRDAHRQRQHDGGVAQGEEEPHPQWALAFLQQVAGGVIDGGDVVGVEGVAQPEPVGQRPGPGEDQGALAVAEVVVAGLGVVVVEHPESHDVQQRHEPEQPGQPRDLIAGESGPLGVGRYRARCRGGGAVGVG